MGMDVYVGSLRRYFARDWLSVAQQAGAAAGHAVALSRAPGTTAPTPDDVAPHPADIEEAVLAWQERLLRQLGRNDPWPEDPASPYWTDRPGWDGYGALVLLAAYDECPELRPARAGIFRRAAPPDVPRDHHTAPAVVQASKNPERYPGLLLGAEWWLPLPGAPPLFEAPLPTGQETVFSTVEQLRSELALLAERQGLDAAALATLRRAGPRGPANRRHPSEEGEHGPRVETIGRYGLAVLSALAERAEAARQPLVLDY